MQHTATHCNALQHTATHCNTLQHTATHCNTLQHNYYIKLRNVTHCDTLQRTATHCNTLQHTATHCNTLQHTATQLLHQTEKRADFYPHNWLLRISNRKKRAVVSHIRSQFLKSQRATQFPELLSLRNQCWAVFSRGTTSWRRAVFWEFYGSA